MLQSKLTDAAAYDVTVKTGNMKGAATDARVYMEIFGIDDTTGGSGEIRLLDLESSTKPFRRNTTDNFTVSSTRSLLHFAAACQCCIFCCRCAVLMYCIWTVALQVD